MLLSESFHSNLTVYNVTHSLLSSLPPPTLVFIVQSSKIPKKNFLTAASSRERTQRMNKGLTVFASLPQLPLPFPFLVIGNRQDSSIKE